MVAMPPCQREASYSRRYNEGKPPQISDRVKGLLTMPQKPKPRKGEKTYWTSKLLRGLLFSVKKRGKFANFSKNVNVVGHALYDDSILLREMFYQRQYSHFRRRILIGESLIYDGWISLYLGQERLYRSLIGRIFLLHELMYDKKRRDYYPNNFGVNNALECYIKDELEKENVKIYPNEIAFIFYMGTIFACVSLTTMIAFICFFFSIKVGLAVSLLVGFVAWFKRI